jgi:hypothetical protein
MKTMMKSLVLAGIVAMFFAFTACEKEQINADDIQYLSILSVDQEGVTSVVESNLKSVLMETSDPTEEELALLIEMKEEEKLAHDVYIALYEKWGSQIFSNIASAEERHLNAIICLLEYFGSDQTSVGDPGVFTIEEFQTLYNDLVAAGSLSLVDALKTGLLIEEMDIVDLREALNVVSNDNIILVFENLLKASRNHLRAFNRKLVNMGETYIPVYLTQEDYDDIVNTPMETGKKYRANCNEGENYQNRFGHRRGHADGKTKGPAGGNSWGEKDGEGNSWGEQDGEGNSYGEQDGEGNSYGEQDGEGNSYGEQDGEGNSYGEQDGEGNSYGEQDGEGNSYGEQDGEGEGTSSQNGTSGSNGGN